MEKLKSCPFCGSANVGSMNDTDFIVDIWWVECRECFSRTMTFTNEKEAIEAWNRRANADETD